MKIDSEISLKQFAQKHLLTAVLSLLVFALFFYVLNLVLGPEVVVFAEYVEKEFGFTGFLLFQWIVDSIISPFPPDFLLVLVLKNPNFISKWSPIFQLSIMSVLAGQTGYLIGLAIAQIPPCAKYFEKINGKIQPFVKKFGFWAVVIGALTPFPFSITCWSAGFLRMNWKVFFLATLTRIPRFFIYYWILSLTQISS